MSFAIVACARDENRNINEWLAYHYSIGFDHVFLFCNDDNPEALFKTVLPWISLGKLTFRHHETAGEQHHMYLLYTHLYKSLHEWVSFLDVDEFFCLRNCDSVKDFVNKFENVDCIYFNWLHYGTNWHKTQPDGLTLRQYTKRENRFSTTTKVILRTRCIDIGFIESHRAPFWHGYGYDHWRLNPFNFDSLRGVSATNARIDDVNQEWLDRNYDKVLWSGYIAHFYMRSEEYIHHRIARGEKLGAGWLLDWKARLEDGRYAQEVERTNAVDDLYLSNYADKNLHFPIN